VHYRFEIVTVENTEASIGGDEKKKRWIIHVSELALILHFKATQYLLIMFSLTELY